MGNSTPDPFTCFYFGNLLALCDDKTYAIRLYEWAAEITPDLAVVQWCRANLYRKMRDYDLADRAYHQAVAVAPDDEQARDVLAGWLTFLASRGGNLPTARPPDQSL